MPVFRVVPITGFILLKEANQRDQTEGLVERMQSGDADLYGGLQIGVQRSMASPTHWRGLATRTRRNLAERSLL